MFEVILLKVHLADAKNEYITLSARFVAFYYFDYQ